MVKVMVLLAVGVEDEDRDALAKLLDESMIDIDAHVNVLKWGIYTLRPHDLGAVDRWLEIDND